LHIARIPFELSVLNGVRRRICLTHKNSSQAFLIKQLVSSLFAYFNSSRLSKMNECARARKRDIVHTYVFEKQVPQKTSLFLRFACMHQHAAFAQRSII
jgi:hypothetical protein